MAIRCRSLKHRPKARATGGGIGSNERIKASGTVVDQASDPETTETWVAVRKAWLLRPGWFQGADGR